MTNDPVLIAYVVHNRAGKKPKWVRIGAAFPHDRGAGLTLVVNAMPLGFDGRIVMVEPRHDPDEFHPRLPPPPRERR